MTRLLRRLRHAGFVLPAVLTAGLWLKGLHRGLPGLSCPLRALTGIPCPACYLTRATAAALTGQLQSSLELHAFGPLVAAGLLAWSVLAIHQRRLVLRGLPSWLQAQRLLGWGAVGLMGYWLLRLGSGLGFSGFPGFPDQLITPLE